MGGFDENYAGQEEGTAPEIDLLARYGRTKGARHKDPTAEIPLDDDFLTLLRTKAEAGSAIAANILALEGFEVILDGEPFTYQGATFHEPPPRVVSIRSQEGIVERIMAAQAARTYRGLRPQDFAEHGRPDEDES